MAIIPCPECKSEVSTAAQACPKCGYPIAKVSPQPAPPVVPPVNISQPIALSSDPPNQAAPPQVAYAPRQPQLKVRPLGVLCGLFLLGFGLFLALNWVPAHDIERIRSLEAAGFAVVHNDGFLERDFAKALYIFAWALVVMGTAQLLTGSFKRDGIIGFCKACDMSVNARRKLLGGLRCERCRGVVTK